MKVPVDAVLVCCGVTCFLLVVLRPREALRRSEREFLLERLHVLVISEASLACV